VTLLVALAAGAVIGLGLGALGGGGSILAVPVLIFLLGEGPAEATTGSLVVVGATALTGVVAAHRAGTVRVARGLGFGLVAIGGAVVGARAAARVDPAVLLAAFSVLMLLAGTSMALRGLRTARREAPAADDRPIVEFRPAFVCRCPRALKVLVTATAVGLLTGFLGVGGGFVVVPALVLALSMPIRQAAGTSLVVIAVTSAAALLARAGSGVDPRWAPVLVLTAAAVVGGWAGVRLAARTPPDRLARAFTALVVAVALGTAAYALPALG
jgi:uncharacterized protein